MLSKDEINLVADLVEIGMDKAALKAENVQLKERVAFLEKMLTEPEATGIPVVPPQG